MSYTLSYKDRYLRIAESKVTSDTSQSQQFYFIPDNTETLIRTKWTGKQWHKLLTCIETGADLMFPEEANEIIWQFIKTITTPPEVPSENECFEYLPSANFIHYFPDNPYLVGDKAFGWYKEAWWRFLDFDTIFPDWIDNWIAGNAAALLGYLPTDVIFNIESLISPSILAFLNDGGVLPKIRIDFTGQGEINVTLLSFPLGGKCIIELDQEPNVLDILTGGVLDPGAFMVELNRDIVNFPPDEYPIVQIPLTVDTPGAHSLYINFIPVIDDAAFPLLFGGGLRGVELCGFGEQGTMGIEQIIWDGCELKAITGGVETVIVTAQQIQDCLVLPPGGGGTAALAVRTLQITVPGGSDFTSLAPTYANIGSINFSHTPSHSKLLLIVDNHILLNSGAANDTDVRWTVNGNGGVQGTRARVHGTNSREVQWSDWFENLDIGVAVTCQLQGRVSAGTGTINQNAELNVTIIEFDNLEDLFVEDIQYLDGVLQKKLGGIWTDVVDIQALLDPIIAAANAANTVANQAANTANQALNEAQAASNVNSQQNVIIADHESRLDSIEQVDLPQIQLTLNNHETRIDALESAPGGGSTWGGMKLGLVQHMGGLLNPSGGIYTVIDGSYQTNPTFAAGFQANASGEIELEIAGAMKYGTCVILGIVIMHDNAAAYNFEFNVNGKEPSETKMLASAGNNHIGWVIVQPNLVGIPPSPSDFMELIVRETTGLASQLDWRLVQINYNCIQINPFTGVLFP